MKKFKRRKQSKNNLSKRTDDKEEELRKFLKELGIKTKEVPENLSTVDEEFSLFLQKS